MRPVGSKYLLEEPLGRGATGTVWRGRQRETAGEEAAVAGQPGEPVAIKVLKEELAQDPDVVMRFLRERSVLLRISRDAHDNIVRTRDLVVEGELLALVMDLVDGPDLHRYLYENGPFTPVAAALLTAQVADALAAAHGRGVVHRDLKPANVLLSQAAPPDGGEQTVGAAGPETAGHGQPAGYGDSAGHGEPTSSATHPAGTVGEQMRPMLTDFGIARLADAPGVTRSHEFVGSPSYVAPESAEGREQTSAVDLYSAGIMLHELVTGEPPFRAGSTLELLQRHISEQPVRPPQMAEPLWTVIERCLRKNPDERPSAASLGRALRVVAAGLADDASPQERDAALGVAALLHPDTGPVRVPGSGIGAAGSSEPTRAMPGGSAEQGGPGVAGAAAAGAAGAALGAAAAGSGQAGESAGSSGVDETRAMPAQGAQPDDPHPWENQLRAARDRNEPTQVQPPVDSQQQDPLYRPPQRPAPQDPSAAPRRPQRRSSAYGQGYGYPGQQPQYQQPQQYQQYQQPGYPPPYQQPAYQQPPPYQQPQHQPQQPQQRQQRQRPAPEPREPRERRGRSRSANPMRIPGLGCLKGCLFMVLVLAVIAVLLWNFTPLPDWVAEGRSFWDTVTDTYDDVRNWMSLPENPGSTTADLHQS